MTSSEIRDAALVIVDPVERRKFLERVCGIDTDQRREVERMLAVSDQTGAESHPVDCFETRAPQRRSEPLAGGRYRFDKKLGAGAFGEVWRGFDEQLGRPVAIKISKPAAALGSDVVEAFRREARAVAALPAGDGKLVEVHDVGCLDDGRVYIVIQYIHGPNLRERLKLARVTARDAARLCATVARALERIHKNGLIHRDVKPENILIDEAEGIPYLADFGVSISRARSVAGHEVAGTPPYMSPEQVQGEHVDPRSDVFSLGVVLYEMLAGRRPFDGASREELWASILHNSPVKPSVIVPSVPADLDRICLQALSKAKLDRYPSALVMARDLERWLAKSGEDRQPEVTVVPKGLRSFDGADARFYLQLLPGPREEDGLPQAVRLWKAHLEQTDALRTFAVGVLSGPSGCGKSSLVRAGIVPRLDAGVRTIVLDASGDDTERRMLVAIRRMAPEIPADTSLRESLARLRERGDGKTVLIIDQLEQWLQSHPDPDATELVSALRECDGGRLQTLVLVRQDYDFYRFMEAVGQRINQSHNWNWDRVDLFAVDHAREVLSRFGQGLGRLPASLADMSADQAAFIDRATDGLAGEQRRVAPVQLALFADLVKSLPWTPETLETLGDTVGGSRRLLDRVGVAFLEGAFHARSANPAHRVHASAAKRVLESLLPEDSGTSIKRRSRSMADLLAASDYAARPRDFGTLMAVLDEELRLITPTDSSGERGRSVAHYQLTHDYLVPAIRDWLMSGRRRTWKGRAELALADRTAYWSERQEVQQLPFFTEWLRIRALTRPGDWRPRERRMMARADRHHGTRSAILVACLGVAVAMAHGVRQRIIDERADDTVRQILDLPAEKVVEKVARVTEDPSIAEIVPEKLRHAFDMSEDDAHRFTAAVAELLMSKGDSANEGRYHAFFAGRLFGASEAEADLISRVVKPREELIGPLLEELNRDEVDHRLPASSAEREIAGVRKAKAGAMLSRLGRPEPAWPLWRHSMDPRIRSELIRLVPRFGCPPETLVDRLAIEDDVSARRALLLSLGEYDAARLSLELRDEVADRVRLMFREDADPGMHAAARWMLVRWGERDWVEECERAWSESEHSPWALGTVAESRGWFVDRLGMTYTVVGRPVTFRMGSPEDERDRQADETYGERTIPAAFAISTTAVTCRQLAEWPELPAILLELGEKPGAFLASADDTPAVLGLTWDEAARFCNWMSDREGIPPEEWCYEEEPRGPDHPDREPRMRPRNGARLLGGVRLPAEEELEYAIRAGATTSRFFGESEHLLGDYAWYVRNAGGRIHRVAELKPNDLGLFDALGNCFVLAHETEDDENCTRLFVERGGSWFTQPGSIRSANRAARAIIEVGNSGWRLARTLNGRSPRTHDAIPPGTLPPPITSFGGPPPPPPSLPTGFADRETVRASRP